MKTKVIVLSLSMLCAFGRGECIPDSTTFLLLDKRIIESTENVKLEVGKVEKHYSASEMTLEERAKPYREHPEREMGICYATSKDGIHWEKPDLGLVEYNGSQRNNIVWRGPHGAGVIKDLSE